MAQSYWRRSDHSLECELILDVGSVIVLSNTAFGAAKGDFGRYGKMFIMTGQKEFEDNADDRNPCSEDKHVRSEGRNRYWRRHHDDLWCGFFFSGFFEWCGRKKWGDVVQVTDTWDIFLQEGSGWR